MMAKQRTASRRSSAMLDQLRAEALKGHALADLSDADREWIWRSLLKGVRRREAVQLSGLTHEQVPRALRRVKRWYQQRMDAYKREQAKEAMQPKVVRPIAPVRIKTPQRRGRGLFGLFGK